MQGKQVFPCKFYKFASFRFEATSSLQTIERAYLIMNAAKIQKEKTMSNFIPGLLRGIFLLFCLPKAFTALPTADGCSA
jgi:hypothetical protein